MSDHFLSKDKFEALQAELQNLEKVTRKEVADKLEYARSLGDLSENAEYHDARNQQAEIESRINYLQDLLKHAQIVEQHHSDSIEVGSTVTVKRTKDGEKITYTIVDEEESDIDQNKISWSSPLGQALLGKKKKEDTTLQTPKGKVEYTIVDIA